MKFMKYLTLLVVHLNIFMTVNGQSSGIIIDSAGFGVQVIKTQFTGLYVNNSGFNGVQVDLASVYGVQAYGKNGNYFRGDKGTGKADIILGGMSNGLSSGDDGVITSDPVYPGSDLFLQANDAVIARINNNSNGNGNFFVWDGNNTNLFQVQADGTVRVKGTTVHGSDLNMKESIQDLAYSEILKSVIEMPVYEWQYKGQDRRYIGPMAQDFHKAFGLGNDDTTIAAIDADGVALAAIKAQQEIIEEQKKEINSLKQKVGELDKLQKEISQLKELVSHLVTQIESD